MATRRMLEPGDNFGEYKVEKLIGRGGMAAVYLICHRESGARYAAKIMLPPSGEYEYEFRRRFVREAELAMKLDHRNLIKVYDAGEDPETGLCYIIMEYVPCGTVKERLKKKGKFSVREAVSVTAQIASALAVAHAAGVAHRDIKPDNIMFDAKGVPKLADMGIAKKFDDEGESTTALTGTGMMIGTPAYMAPEQMMDSNILDGRADVYSLGVVFFEMLTGVRPNMDATATELLALAMNGQAFPDVRELNPEVPEAIAKIVEAMCRADLNERIQSAEEVARLCVMAFQGKVDTAKLSNTLKRKRLVQTVKPYLIGFGMSLALGALVIAGMMIGRMR